MPCCAIAPASRRTFPRSSSRSPTKDRPLLRRVLGPRDYLDPGRAPMLLSEGIGPGGEASLRVFLDSSRSRATGYRLYLFYPS